VRREDHDDQRSNNVCSVYELPEDFNVSCDDVRESDDGEVHELSDDGEVHELSYNDLEVPHARASQARSDVSYVPARVTRRLESNHS
jgi:hypothetical protein